MNTQDEQDEPGAEPASGFRKLLDRVMATSLIEECGHLNNGLLRHWLSGRINSGSVGRSQNGRANHMAKAGLERSKQLF